MIGIDLKSFSLAGAFVIFLIAIAASSVIFASTPVYRPSVASLKQTQSSPFQGKVEAL